MALPAKFHERARLEFARLEFVYMNERMVVCSSCMRLCMRLWGGGYMSLGCSSCMHACVYGEEDTCLWDAVHACMHASMGRRIHVSGMQFMHASMHGFMHTCFNGCAPEQMRLGCASANTCTHTYMCASTNASVNACTHAHLTCSMDWLRYHCSTLKVPL